MAKEFRLPFDKIADPQTITQVNAEEFKKHDLDIHKNEVNEIVDDHSRQERVYKVKNTKYFGPWSHRG